ncbi:DUF2812 domain-containing protein [Candidatus Enterococcus clewellii]|uniref:DUF2812 domain-containing protein n=1 Tax=Candidatus Enterococcus clewellii TaxID=1834193 RepID=A0A242K4R0_9ENTE|nr:DUF2812 domain-containing protein [Enterococcus sp. 9E7_DIV0242]OTP14517.1 hypothetical protein A5888_002618 [Enterococcus sp. 9E7_DIV0242]
MKKEVVKYFGLADYLEEERFLADQHRSGWKMVGAKKLGWSYVFEKCEPEEYIYQLDFIENDQVDEDYFQLFEDCGWEYFHKLNNWYYFRKKKSENKDENAIFNDAASRAEMAKKVMRSQWIILLPLLIIFFSLSNTFRDNSSSIIWIAVFTIYSCLVAIIVGLSIRTYRKLDRIIKANQPL